jgi:hypothetical protein
LLQYLFFVKGEVIVAVYRLEDMVSRHRGQLLL